MDIQKYPLWRWKVKRTNLACAKHRETGSRRATGVCPENMFAIQLPAL